jgi:eukaryotic-like serine/threonine-protein kinase
MRHVLVTVLVSAAVSAGMFFVLQRYAPTGGGAGTGLVDVPNLAGLSAEQARQLLEPAGLQLEILEQVDDPRYRAGQISQHMPLSGSRVQRGATVKAKVARVVERVRVPPIVGRAMGDATGLLEAVHLKAGARTERLDDKATPGTVLESSPVPGTEVPVGSAVDLVLASAKMVEVPKVTGRGLGGAKQLITAAGLVVGEVKYGRNEDIEDGIVTRQTPAAATKAAAGSKVDLVVNTTD